MVKWGERVVPLRNNLAVVWQQVGHLKNEDQILDHSIKPQNISLTATPAPAQIVTVHLGSHPNQGLQLHFSIWFRYVSDSWKGA